MLIHVQKTFSPTTAVQKILYATCKWTNFLEFDRYLVVHTFCHILRVCVSSPSIQQQAQQSQSRGKIVVMLDEFRPRMIIPRTALTTFSPCLQQKENKRSSKTRYLFWKRTRQATIHTFDIDPNFFKVVTCRKHSRVSNDQITCIMIIYNVLCFILFNFSYTF